ncbi:VanZ family protein [Nocardioides sp. NPDC126508]
MFIEPFFRSLPLALPTMIGACVLALAGAPWWSKWLKVPRTVAIVFVAVCGAYLGVTATPTGSGLWANPGGSRGVSLDLHPPPLGNLLMISSDSLNLLAGAALGVVSVLVWCSGRRWLSASTAVGLPLMVEVVQLLFPGMGRVGFLLTDVVVNWAGAGIGAGIEAGIAIVIGAVRSVKTVPELSPLRTEHGRMSP